MYDNYCKSMCEFVFERLLSYYKGGQAFERQSDLVLLVNRGRVIENFIELIGT